MSDGITHRNIALAVEGVVLVAPLIMPTDFAIGAVIGGCIGVLITPDIDHEMRTVEESRWYHLGPVVGKAWQVLWSPYPILFRHRGWSHTPVIGTLSRLIVLWFQLLAYSLAIGFVTGIDMLGWWRGIFYVRPDILIGVFGAWCLQDIVHGITDTIYSTRKKRIQAHVKKSQFSRG